MEWIGALVIRLSIFGRKLQIEKSLFISLFLEEKICALSVGCLFHLKLLCSNPNANIIQYVE